MSNLKDNLDRAGEYAGEKLRRTQTKVRESADAAKSAATDAYTVARERANAAYATARTRASETGRKARGAIEDNPVAAVVGGLAVGALIGALIPRTRREGDLLGGLGGKIGEAGRDQLDKMGLTAEAARDKVTKLIDGAVDAVRGQQDR